ncbi:MAG: hypothetical protein KJO54_04895 [Gammaproteobacteria bacterium]|nr:hypothetical protein [Gammaproteobacteria bacterium]
MNRFPTVVAIALGAALMLIANPAPARDTAGNPGSQQTIGERAYKRLEQAHTALGEKKYSEALARLQQMEELDLNDYERALVYQTYGFLGVEQGQYGSAIEYFERCLSLEALPDTAQQGMLYSLAGLYSAEGRQQMTIDTLMRWLPNEPAPSPDAYIMLAAAHAELGQYPAALPWVEKAVAGARQPKESWFQLLVAVYFETRDYSGAATALRQMIALWPDKPGYWENLSGAYQQLGSDVEAVATMKLAWRRDLLKTESKLLNLARMMMYVEDPYQAGSLLDAEMQRGRVARNRQNLELLLRAWTGAKEFDNAISVIDQLAPMTGDGEYYLRKAQLYAERANWELVVPAAEQAIARGGLRKAGAPWILKGMAEAELGRFKDAIDSLTEAKKYGDNFRRQAEGWLQFVNDRMQVAARA